jgi:hypothetical protein
LRTLTNSALQTFVQCPRKYDIAYNHRCKPERDSDALRIGSMFHEWMEVGGPVLASDMSDEASWIVAAMALAYTEHYGDRPEMHERELLLEAPLVNPDTGRASRTFAQAGKTDGVIASDDGLRLYELKTTGMAPDSLMPQLRRGTQLATYSSLWARMGGAPIVGHIVDIVKKPRLKRREGEEMGDWADRLTAQMMKNPDAYFLREELPWSQAHVEETDRVYWQAAKMIRYCDRHGYIAARGAHCKTLFGGCEYRRLCWHGDSEGYRISDTSHEELYGDKA